MAFTLLDLERIIQGLRRRLRLLEIQGNSAVFATGLAADRPVTPVVTSGTTISFYATDTKTLSVFNVANAAWDEIILS